MSEKCFCHLSVDGEVYQVKDAEARNIISKINKEPLFLGAFFDINENLNFYASRDLINYSKLNINVDGIVRDPSLLEVDGVLYIAYTKQSSTCDFALLKTTDLVNFEVQEIDLGMDKSRNRWAPSLMLDGDKIILSITSRAADGSNAYIYKSESAKDTLSFSNPIKIELDKTYLLDSEIIKYNDVYYMLVKDEEGPSTLLYKSIDNSNYTYVRELEEFPSGKNKCEGAFAIPLEDKIFIGCDNYDSPSYNESLQLGLFTNNIEELNNSNTFIINNGNDSLCRHGSTIKINNINLKANIIDKQETISSKDNNKYSLQYLDNYATDGVIDELYVFPNVVYILSAGTYTINKLINPFGCERVNFMFKGNETVTLVIGNNGYRDINKTFRNSVSINETIMSFIYTKEGFYPVNYHEPRLKWNTDIGVGEVEITCDTNNNVFTIPTSGDRTVTLSSESLNPQDIYFLVSKVVTGNFTFCGYTIDLSTIPDETMIHFKRYANTYKKIH